MKTRSFIWITKHKKVAINSGIPIQMEIPKLVKFKEFKSHGKRMQADIHNSQVKQTFENRHFKTMKMHNLQEVNIANSFVCYKLQNDNQEFPIAYPTPSFLNHTKNQNFKAKVQD